jgi:tetratricopeptide (TPR) repeat protein
MDRSEFMLRAARCHASMGRLDIADNWFIGARKEAPERREITFFYGVALIRVRKLDDAIVMFQNCLSIPASARPFSIYDAAMAWDDKQVQEAIDFCRTEIGKARKKAEEASRAS